MGADLFAGARAELPLDLVGMAPTSWRPRRNRARPLPAFAARYRFLFSPVRYSSLGLSTLEGMMAGMPVVALATAEMATVIEHGVSGFVDTDTRQLLPCMRALLRDPGLARRLGEGARRTALERFSASTASAPTGMPRCAT
jgi:glycosyltransferase involved in cell wall biosynthesis